MSVKSESTNFYLKETVSNTSISVEINPVPVKYDIVFIPTGKSGIPGQFGIEIVNRLGINDFWTKINKEDGYNGNFRWHKELKSTYGIKNICFISLDTIGVTRHKSLIENLTKALKEELSNFPNKRIWIPLIGTGSVGITAKKSFESVMRTINAIFPELKSIGSSVDFTIALSKDIEQKDFEEFNKIFDSQILDLTNKNTIATSVPAWMDNPEVKDLLNRTPLAAVLANIIRSFKNDRGSFMIHLEGPWGSGKSTFLNILEKQLNPDNKPNNWVVIKFNAWQNQHISTPWWTLLYTIYKQGRRQVKNWLFFWISETNRRWKMSSYYLKFLSFFFLLLTILSAFMVYRNASINEYIALLNSPENDADIKVFLELTSLIISLLITLYSFFKILTSSLFGRSTKNAESFLKLAHDPMEQIKSHFNSLINSINKPVIIFIDDLDRCNPQYVVTLLEGIQTLFRNTKVFYIVAADKQWIAKCFEIEYGKFEETIKNAETNLGYKFLQKLFQLSFRLPLLTEELKNNYWLYILKLKEPEYKEIKDELKDKFSKLENEEELNDLVSELQKDKNVSESMIRKAAVEQKIDSEFKEKTEHILQNYSNYLDSNPRSIKRTASYYDISQSSLMILNGAFFEKSVLIRWLVLNQKYPLLVEKLERDPSSFKSLTAKLQSDAHTTDETFLANLINGKDIDGKDKDVKMSLENIKDLVGVI